MVRRLSRFGSWLIVLGLICSLFPVSSALGQPPPPAPPPPTPVPDPDIIINNVPNGVIVDADGVLRDQAFLDPTGELTRQRLAAARASLPGEVTRGSKLRKVSLNRLEAAVRRRLDEQLPLTEEMQFLAGLTRLQYVFYYPDTGDIVIAGPAEGWVVDLAGRPRGMKTGRPALELQDLVVALRAYPPAGEKTRAILVSIDPTPEGLSRMHDFLSQFGSRATPDDTETIVEGLRTSLGLQNIRVGGIPANTHFAQVMIEADYRMKLIGIGLEEPPVKLASYVDRANPAHVARNALQRWYFIPDYQCVRVTDDDLGMELVGDSVRLVGEDQVVSRDGARAKANRGNKASQGFVDNFTRKYSELARYLPVYAQMRNLIDMSVAAAFIQQRDWHGKASWKMETFGNEEVLAVQTFSTPVHVETVVASVWRGNRLMTPVGGGVHVEPLEALKSPNLLADEKGKVSASRAAISLDKLGENRWWWD